MVPRWLILNLIVCPPHRQNQFYFIIKLLFKASTLPLNNLNVPSQAQKQETIPKHFLTKMTQLQWTKNLQRQLYTVDRATLPGNDQRHQIRPEISLLSSTLNLLLVKDLNYSITVEPPKDLNYIKFKIGQAVYAFAIQPIRHHNSERTTQLALPNQL